jgi:hypothetical protein
VNNFLRDREQPNTFAVCDMHEKLEPQAEKFNTHCAFPDQSGDLDMLECETEIIDSESVPEWTGRPSSKSKNLACEVREAPTRV